jgi:FAD/FMN-containing dehydrogenase
MQKPESFGFHFGDEQVYPGGVSSRNPLESAGRAPTFAGNPTQDEGAERVKSAYGPEKYARLVALKQKYDPTNLFRLNQNIKPSAG